MKEKEIDENEYEPIICSHCGIELDYPPGSEPICRDCLLNEIRGMKYGI